VESEPSVGTRKALACRDPVRHAEFPTLRRQWPPPPPSIVARGPPGDATTYDQAMTHMTERDDRAVRLLGIGFAVLFTVASTALLGELVGAFADAPASFT
jgi:hypothetical protein